MVSESSRFAEPRSESPGFLLWHLTSQWQRQVTASLAPLGLTHTQFVILACTNWLNSSDGPVPQVDIARHAGTDPQTASQVLRRLEKAALLTREVDPQDSRALLIEVTELGQKKAVEAVVLVEAADEQFFAELPPSFRQAVLRCGKKKNITATT